MAARPDRSRNRSQPEPLSFRRPDDAACALCRLCRCLAAQLAAARQIRPHLGRLSPRFGTARAIAAARAPQRIAAAPPFRGRPEKAFPTGCPPAQHGAQAFRVAAIQRLSGGANVALHQSCKAPARTSLALADSSSTSKTSFPVSNKPGRLQRYSFFLLFTPSVYTISLSPSRNSSAISTASFIKPPPFPRRSNTRLFIPCFCRSSMFCMNSS